MFIPFQNEFIQPQQQHNNANTSFGIGIQTQPKQQKIKKTKPANISTMPMPMMLLVTVVYVCSALHVSSAMPLQMLLMYSSPSTNQASNHLLFPLHLRSDLDLTRKAHHQPFLANALVSNSDVQPMEELLPSSISNNPFPTLVMKRISPPYGAMEGESDNERPEQKEEQNLLRAGRNIEENTAPKMYARHLGDLGGTMFRFG